MDLLKRIGATLLFWLGSLASLAMAFVTGLQKNFFFAAVSFLAFFVLTVILFQQGLMRLRPKGDDENDESEDKKKAQQ